MHRDEKLVNESEKANLRRRFGHVSDVIELQDSESATMLPNRHFDLPPVARRILRNTFCLSGFIPLHNSMRSSLYPP
jgi:hypothetical protein